MLYPDIMDPHTATYDTSSRFRDAARFSTAAVASRPCTVVRPKANPSSTPSLRITTPANTDVGEPGE